MERWVAALRSGKYKQGHSLLRSTQNHYCCLGVLCDVLGVEWRVKSEANISYLAYESETYLPDTIVEIAEMKSKNGIIHGTSLVNFNDVYRKNFNEIADIIEQNWEYL